MKHTWAAAAALTQCLEVGILAHLWVCTVASVSLAGKTSRWVKEPQGRQGTNHTVVTFVPLLALVFSKAKGRVKARTNVGSCGARPPKSLFQHQVRVVCVPRTGSPLWTALTLFLSVLIVVFIADQTAGAGRGTGFWRVARCAGACSVIVGVSSTYATLTLLSSAPAVLPRGACEADRRCLAAVSAPGASQVLSRTRFAILSGRAWIAAIRWTRSGSQGPSETKNV